MTSPWRQIQSLAQTELRIEARSGHTLWTTLPYAVTALLIIALAVGADIALLRRIGIGTYWSVVLLFGALVCSRQSTTDRAVRHELLALLGIDPAVRFLSRALASSLVVLLFAILLAPATVVLYDVAVDRVAPFAVAAVLVSAGIGSLGTLATELTMSPDTPLTSVATIVTPLSVPLMLAGVQVLQPTTTNTGIAAWLLLSLTGVLVFVVAGLLTARPLQEVST